MHFHGTRRARGLILILSLLLVWGIARLGQFYFAQLRQGLVPTLLAEARKRLERDIRVEHLRMERPGHLVAEGVRIARGKSFAQGTLLAARRVEVDFDPGLLHWTSLLSRGLGRNTRARVRAYEVRAWQPAPLPPEPLASSETVVTELDLGPVLRGGGDMVATIPWVDLGGAQARVSRDRGGHWSFEELVKPRPGQPPTTFRGVIRGRNCRLEVVDSRSGALPPPAVNQGTGAFSVGFEDYPSLRYSAGLRVAGAQGGTLQLEGYSRPKTKEWLAGIQADTGALEYWYRYFSRQVPGLQVSGAAGSARVTLWGGGAVPPGAEQYRVALDVRRATVRFKDVAEPLTGFQGRLLVNPNLALVDGAAAIAGIPLRVSGEVVPGRTPRDLPRLSFRAASEQLTLAALRRVAPKVSVPEALALPGVFSAVATVEGENGAWTFEGRAALPDVAYTPEKKSPASAGPVRVTYRGRVDARGVYALEGAVEAPRVRYRDTEGQDLRLEYQVREGLVQVRGGFRALGGSVTASGWLEPGREPMRVYAVGKAEDVDVEQVPWERGETVLKGTASAEYILSGTLDAPEVSAYVRARPLTVDDETLDEVAGRVHWKDGDLEIPYAIVRDPRFQATLSGTMNREGELDLQVAGNGVDLATALAGRVKEPVRGSAFVAASVKGTLKQPRVEGRFQVYQPEFREYRADYGEARFAARSARDVQVFDVKLVRAPVEITTPLVTLTRDDAPDAEWQVRSELTVSGLSLPGALRLAGFTQERLEQEPVAGELEPVRVSLDGPLSGLRAGFSARVTGAAVRGVDLGRVEASGQADLARNLVTLERVTASSPTGQVELEGTVAFDPKAKGEEAAARTVLDLRFTSAAIRLLPLVRRYAPDLLDRVELRGTLRSASGRLTGSLKAPAASLTLALSEVQVNGRALEIEPLRVEWTPEALLLRDFKTRLGSGTVEAPYLAALLGEETRDRRLLDRLAGTLQLRDVPVEAVRQLLEDSPYYASEAARTLRETLTQWRHPVAGDVSLALRLPAGTAAAPDSAPAAAALIRGRALARLEGELSGSDLLSPPAADLPASRLTSRFAYTSPAGGAPRFELPQFRVERTDGALLTVTGSQTGRSGNNDGQMAFEARATGYRLSSLARLPIAGLRQALAAAQPLEGTLQASARVEGTPRAPQVRFSAEIEQPVLAGVPFDRFSIPAGQYLVQKGEGLLQVLDEPALLARKRSADEPDLRVLFTGELPVTWPDLKIPRDRQRHLTVAVPQQSLVVFNELAEAMERQGLPADYEAAERTRAITGAFRRLAATNGRLEGRVTLGGTADTPQNDGYLSIADATLQLDELQTRVLDFNTRLELSKNVLTVRRFAGRSSLGGSFEGGGDIILGRKFEGDSPAQVDLSLAVNQFKFGEKKVGSLLGEAFRGTQLKGTLQSVDPRAPGQAMPLVIAGYWPTPIITGGIALDQSSLVLPFGPVTQKRPGRLPGDVQLGLNLFLGPDVWIRNPGVNLKLGGSLQAINSVNTPDVRGRLTASRGTFTVAGLRLRGVNGSINVAYDGPNEQLGVRPASAVSLDLTGETSIRMQRSPTTETEDYDLTFRIRGSPGEGDGEVQRTSLLAGLSVGSPGGLTLEVRADPPLPSGEIEALIRQQVGLEGFVGGGSNVVEALPTQIERALSLNLSTALTGKLEDMVQSRLGLSIFSLELGISQPLRLRIGRRLFDRFYGTLTQEFSMVGEDQRRFELYYRVTPRLRVGYRREEPFGGNVFFFSGGFSF